MTTRHLVDPELLPTLDHIPDVQFTTESLGQIRAMMKQNRQPVSNPELASIAVSERFVPGQIGAPSENDGSCFLLQQTRKRTQTHRVNPLGASQLSVRWTSYPTQVVLRFLL